MDLTPDNRATLRANLLESIPAGGSDAQTLFPDAEIDQLLASASSLAVATAMGWERKAIKVVSASRLVQAQIGQESLKWSSPLDLRKVALEEAQRWWDRAAQEGQPTSRPTALAVVTEGPSLPGITAPARLGGWSPEAPCSRDASRLWAPGT